MAIVTKQPFKLAYVLAAFAFELARFPIFPVKYLISYGRQHPKWTFRQAISTRILSSLLRHISTIQNPTPLPLVPGSEKERFVLIKPAKADLYQGPLRAVDYIQPEVIGATWYPAPLSVSNSPQRNVKVILHIHGGAYVSGDGRTGESGYMAAKLLKHTPATHLLFPQYRLSTLPASKTSNPFPAALQDSLTAYLYLLHDVKIAPEDIIFSGDSAGANNATALLRYLSEHGPSLGIPNPSAALLWSSWIDPSDTSDSYVHDNPNYATDYIPPPFTFWSTSAYAGLSGPKILSHPYVSHKNNPFKTPVPLFVNAGGAELLYFDVVEWAGQMNELGNDVALDVTKNVPHDVLLLGNILGFDNEAVEMVRKAGEWLREKGW